MKPLFFNRHVGIAVVSLCFAASLISLINTVEPFFEELLVGIFNFLGRRAVHGFVPIDSYSGISWSLIGVNAMLSAVMVLVATCLMFWLLQTQRSA